MGKAINLHSKFEAVVQHLATSAVIGTKYQLAKYIFMKLIKRLKDLNQWFTLNEVAKMLAIPGIGEYKLFEVLRNRNVLQSDNHPYQRYVENGYIKLYPKYNAKANQTYLVPLFNAAFLVLLKRKADNGNWFKSKTEVSFDGFFTIPKMKSFKHELPKLGRPYDYWSSEEYATLPTFMKLQVSVGSLKYRLIG